MLGDQRLAGSREDADAAFRSLSAEHGPTLLRLSIVLTEGDRHRVEDMVQESMLRAWKLRADLNIEHRSPRGWLITVARQLAVGARRARQTRPPEAELDDPLASAASNPTPASTGRMIAVAKVSLPLGRRLAGYGLAAAAVVAVTPAVSLLARNAVGRTKQAGRAAAECELLATGAASVLRGPDAFTALLGQARESSRMDSVTLLERGPSAVDATGRAVGWTPVAVSGGSPEARPSDAALTVLATSGLCLALGGRALPTTGCRSLSAFAAFAAAALGRQRLAAAAETARTIAQADRMRIALLAAVSHDLRTPLAAARAAVSCLCSGDIKLTAADHDELLASAEESLNQLGRLISSLLDVSRLQAGALPVFPRPADLGQIIARSLDDLGPQERAVMVDLPPDLPQVMVDAPIMERVIANVTANALRYSPRRSPPLLTASARGDRVELRVIDRGPGIPKAERDRAFLPFQRLGDTSSTTGVGLGLTVSRSLTEAMGGMLQPGETPGGGLTMAIWLPAVTPG